jgi:hypothetical protein
MVVVSVTPRPRFTPGENTPGIHWIGEWMGLRAGLDTEAKGKVLYLCRESNPDTERTCNSRVITPVLHMASDLRNTL